MTSVKNILATTLLGVSLSGCIVVAKPSYADWHQQKELSLSSHQLDALVVEAGAGKLNIKGQNGLDEITVIADIYTSKSAQQDYELTLEQRGSRAYLVAKNESTSGFWVGDSPKIDVVVHVPSQLKLDIDDGSGRIKIDGIEQNIEINDGSGDISISNVTGNISIEDGSGDLFIEQVAGNLTIEDGSGSMVIKSITGDANLEDGSGDLQVRDITGAVTIDDGSGDIEVKNAGDLNVLESGSGELQISGIIGTTKIDS